MELEGKLKSFSLPEVLQFLSMGKMTGTLTLKHLNNQVGLMIKDGKIINTTKLKSRSLGQMLVESGYLKRRDLDAAIQMQQESESEAMLGQILLDQSFAQKDDLEQMLRVQIEEDVWDLFSWGEGEFKFEYGIEPRFDDQLVEIDIQPLLLEGSRRQDEWTKIKKNIPDETSIVRIVPPKEGLDFKFTLEPDEWRILSMIDGRTSVLTLCHRSGLGRFDTYRILSTFLTSSIAELVPVQDVLKQYMERFSPAKADELLDGETLNSLPVEQNVIKSNNSSSKSKGFSLGGSLFGRKKVQPDKDKGKRDSTAYHVVSPMGAFAELMNRYIARLFEREEFSREDALFLYRLWRPILEDYPKADLVKVLPGVIDVSEFERLVEEAEMSPAISACFADTKDALLRLYRMIIQISSQRLGGREVQKYWSESSDPSKLSFSIQYQDDSDPLQEMNTILNGYM